MKEMPNLICGKVAVGGNYNSTRDSLMDMLEVPDEIRPLVSGYRMNLTELRTSGTLKFSDPDVNTVFEVSRFIYERNYDKIH